MYTVYEYSTMILIMACLSSSVLVNIGIITTLGCHAAFAFLGGALYIPYLAMVCGQATHDSAGVISLLACLLPVQIIMGIAYAILACALWPLVAFIVPEHQLGTAYGL